MVEQSGEMEQPEMQHDLDRGNPFAMVEDSPELKKWELDPTDELVKLKELLYGIPKRDGEGNVITTEEGAVVYTVLPACNEEGAEQILTFVSEHTNKIIVLGFYDKDDINQREYLSMVGFAKSILINYERWQLPFSKAGDVFTTVYSLVHSSYTRGLNGNEKIYRAKTHTSHETKVLNENPQEEEQRKPKGLLRRLLTANR